MPKNTGLSSSKITYKDAGVDVEKADSVVEWMKEASLETPDPHAESLVSGIGGFAALFKASFNDLENPVLVSSTDGIGTKLLMGLASGKTKSLAQDLVAMCVNDLLCTGATPLFFLDYFATSALSEDQLKEFFVSLKEACHKSGASLIGGETAELPGLYQKGHFDAAGFSVGVVDQNRAWGPHKVKEGDLVLGLASSGFHSNGYSLLRKIFGEDGGEFADDLMTPTKLYWPVVKEIQKNRALFDGVHACAHITGGGMDNLLRVLPEGLGVELQNWSKTKLYEEAKRRAGLSDQDMYTTFNSGLGMAFVLDSKLEKDFVNALPEDYEVTTKGRVVVSSEKTWTVC